LGFNIKNTEKILFEEGKILNTILNTDLDTAQRNCVASPIHKNRFQKLETALRDLFYKELNSSDSIFLEISPLLVKKVAMFLSGLAFRPAAIGICGETASGKSTIVTDSIDVINSFAQEFILENVVTTINTDDYYYDRSKEVQKAGSFAEFVKTYDLDVPQAMELSLMKKHIQALLSKQSVLLPKYDMSGTAKRFENHTKANPCSVVISEGLFTLTDEIADVFDFKIYVDIDKSVQKRRFYERAQKRGLGDSADRIFQNATDKAEIYIRPCMKRADIVLNGEISRQKYKQFVASFLNCLGEIYYGIIM